MKVFPNLEIGDNIVLNGMCRYFAARHPEIVWAVRWTHADVIAKMFSDLPNFRVESGYEYPGHPGARQAEPETDSVVLGYFNPEKIDWTTVQWDRCFYEQAGVGFSERWKGFKLPENMLTPSGIRRVLTHSSPERGICITRPLPPETVFMERRNSFWDWLPELLSAAQLHLVDSSYLNLAESLWGIGLLRDTELHFHAYAKKKAYGSIPPILKAPWAVYE